ncbi:tail protein X [Sapientia aquatica]|uniref:Phage tail protein n=1 Tax=Sapientia aquatica TaxID=1549640 RepID=A0A4R5W1K1_9BURK|nr:tail protein X [Sapientia aquatica]TDK65973.1 hypothetical protein E2I14_10285 [Sapientia aquatica]
MKLTHITIEGERWDQLAWHYYRRVSLTPLLIEANPHIPIGTTLAAGLSLSIPIVEQQELTAENIPEWAR